MFSWLLERFVGVLFMLCYNGLGAFDGADLHALRLFLTLRLAEITSCISKNVTEAFVLFLFCPASGKYNWYNPPVTLREQDV